MELTFEKVGNQYVAEFQAPSDFNLHIEREEIGVLEVHQRGSEEGKYDFAWGTGVNGRKIVDYDFGALVYPKYIKVVSGSEVVSASVNFNEGGGSGSGSESSISSWRYFDISNSTSDSSLMNMLISNYSHTVKVRESDGYYFMQSGYFFFSYGASNIKDYVIAIAVNTMAYTRMDAESGVTTIDEYFKLQGRTIDEIFSEYGFSEISKEQFISL